MYPITTEQAWADIDRKLRAFFFCTEDDLVANRQGKLSDYQMHRLRGRVRRTIYETLAAGVIGGLVILASRQTLPNAASIALISSCLVVIMVASFLGYKEHRKYAADLAAPQLQVVHGRAKRQRPFFADRRRDIEPEKLVIENMTFRISTDQHDALVDDFIYTVYYLPNSKFIVAVECDRENNIGQKYKLSDVEVPSSQAKLIRPQSK